MRDLIEGLIRTNYNVNFLNIEELPDGRFTGIVTSVDFHDLDHPDRQRQFWEHLREGLGEDSQRLSFFFLYTPEEYAAITDAQAA